jgi:putative ABC transport system permease protein
MFKNYLKTAFRNIKKYKVISAINVFGLSIGIAISLIMLMYVVNEMSYENCHVNKNRIYIMSYEFNNIDWKWPVAPYITCSVLRNEIPEVEKAVRIRKFHEKVKIKVDEEREFTEEKIFYAEPDIFNIFSYKLLYGEKESVLKEPFSIVISRTTASRYFGNEYPIGKVLSISEKPYKVTGIIEDVPPNTHFNVDIILSYLSFESQNKINRTSWKGNIDDITCFLLKENTSLKPVIDKLNDLKLKNSEREDTDHSWLSAYNISEIHWIKQFSDYFEPLGNPVYVYVFLSAAILILIIGCFNFINLSTSNFFERMKEIGIRKVIGAQKNQLVHQFLTESISIITASAIIGLCVFEMLVRKTFTFLGSNYVLASQNTVFYLFLISFLMILIIGIFSGMYPVIFLSKFKPVDIIRKNISTLSNRFSFRKIIVIFQYSITIILLIGITVIYSQLEYMKNTDLGFKKHNVASIDLNFREYFKKYKSDDAINRLQNTYKIIYNELSKYPYIAGIAVTNTYPGSKSYSLNYVRSNHQSEETKIQVSQIGADYDYASLLGLNLIKGRLFSRDISEDTSSNVIINETAVKELGLKESIGEEIIYPPKDKSEIYRVIGVVKDFHLRSKHEKIKPTLIFCTTQSFSKILVRYNSDNISEVNAKIYDVWKNIEPDISIEISDMDSEVNRMYKMEEKLGEFLGVFGILAVIISSLGLLGLTMFLTMKRTKEVGIRKVLGSTTTEIVILLSKQFLKWVLFASIFSWPIAYYIFNKWLQDFAYKINLNIIYFVFATITALIVAFLTVSIRSFKAARANPIESLRYE